MAYNLTVQFTAKGTWQELRVIKIIIIFLLVLISYTGFYVMPLSFTYIMPVCIKQEKIQWLPLYCLFCKRMKLFLQLIIIW